MFSTNMNTIILLLTALVAANLPFLIRHRFLGVLPMARKRFVHEMAEWLIYLILIGFLAYFMETRTSPAHHQNWIFYITVLCLFAILAFPGFVWRYFWHSKKSMQN